jgi:hypothetical protein
MKKLLQTSFLLWFVLSAKAQIVKTLNFDTNTPDDATAQIMPTTPAATQEKLLDLNWKELAQRDELLGGEVISMDGTSVLRIENTGNTPLKIQLFRISNPSITNLTYAIIGQVKYHNVQRDAYLEMWNYFPPLQPAGQTGFGEVGYYSRTLGTSGEMGKITGTSDWRNFSLPFDRNGASGLPTRLEINIFLPGHGTVYLRSAELVEYQDTNVITGNPASNLWWSEKDAPWIGVIGGPIIGCLGALLGWLSGKGKARRLVLAVWQACIAAGILLLIGWFIALATRQPGYVSMPLLVFGIVTTTVFGTIFPTAKKRYDDFEIRRMASIDAMES